MNQKPDYSPEELKALLNSPEARKLVGLLNQAGGDSLPAAAQAAAGGKPQALLDLLGKVTRTPDGARAVEDWKRKTDR